MRLFIKSVLIFFIVVDHTFPIFAKGEHAHLKLYRTKIKLIEKAPPIIGFFYDYNDSTVLLIINSNPTKIANGSFEIMEIGISNIKKIKFRQKGNIGRSAGYGFASGALIGGIVGWSAGCDECDNNYNDGFNKPTSAVILGLPAGIIGAGFGALIGAGSHFIEVEGDIEKFLDDQSRYSKYVISNKIQLSKK
jgi:hypothetical protein